MSVTSFHYVPLSYPPAVGRHPYASKPTSKGHQSDKSNPSSPVGAEDESINYFGKQIWFRVSQLAKKHQQFTENAIRAQIFAAKPRLSAKSKDGDLWISGNGLAPAIRKCGRTVLINEPMYAKWIATGSCGEGEN